MNDEGFKWSEELLNDLEKRIAKLYSKASKKAVKKVKNYLEQFEEEDTEKRQEYESGEISKDEYSKWRRSLMIVGAFYVLRNELTNDLTDVDIKAMQFAASTMLDVYALNVNYEMYCIEHDLMVDLGYSLYNRKAVERLINENPKLLPRPKVNIPKDMKWNRTHIQTAITQGIIQGDSIPDIAKRLERVVGMDKNAAIRNARTAMTGAQNAGRLESMKEAQSKGVGIKKVWIATLDNVTRSSHRHLDGETVDLDKPFSNGLMFPADPDGEPSEVYNCFIPETNIGVDSKIIRSYKHRYEGEIISIKSALGVNFSCTPNHPILTDRGWVAAKFLNEGDNLIVTSCIDNEVSRRNPNINHAFPRIDAIHELFYMFGGKRISELRVNFHGDIPTSEVEIITQKGFLWSDVYTCVRKCIDKFLLKYTDTPLMRKCSFVKHFGRIMRAAFSNISGVCKSFPFIRRCVSHSHIHGLRTIADSNVIFGENATNNIPTNVILPSEIKHRLARKVFLDNVVSVERSNFVGHVYNLQTDDNYYFVNSSITNNGTHCNDIMAIAHNCRCGLARQYDRYKTDWLNLENRRHDKLGNMTYEEWQEAKPIRRKRMAKIIDHSQEIINQTNEAIYNALEIVGNKAADYARALAPVGTGILKNSMTSEVHEDEKAVYIGTDVKYAVPVEFGHRQEVGRYVPAIGKRLVKAYVPAKPFLKPAIVNNLEEYKGIIESELRAKIK